MRQPAPHGVIDPDGQWSGWLTLRLVTRTPLLLPDPETATRDADDHPTYPVRLGPDGQPLLHGASVKGALRSAYEAVTGSRYGVFRGHERALAYRQPGHHAERDPGPGGTRRPRRPAFPPVRLAAPVRSRCTTPAVPAPASAPVGWPAPPAQPRP